VSSRYKQAHNDVRNLMPLHPDQEGPCHKLAHGGKRNKVIINLAVLLGGGNIEKGIAILLQAEQDWGLKWRIEWPQLFSSYLSGR